MYSQRGQSLIETVVAVFILVMGITAALSLAIYSLNASTGIRKQIIGMGLAREGIEAVKHMRDTNWLKDTLSTTCYNFFTSTNTASCYPLWLRPTGAPAPGNGFDILPNGTSESFYLTFDSAGNQTEDFWDLIRTTDRFGLEFDVSANGHGFYYSTGRTFLQSSSEFARKITLTLDTTAPFNQNTGPRLLVTTDVWWYDKGCPRTNDVPTSKKCAVRLQTYLTNWKTY